MPAVMAHDVSAPRENCTQTVTRAPTISICAASSSGYGNRPDCHSSIGGRNGPSPAATSSWPRTRSANSDSRNHSTAACGNVRVSVVTGRRPLRRALLLGSQPAPSRQISRGHQNASAAKPARRSGSLRLRVEHFAIAVDPGGICTRVRRGDVPRRRIDIDPPRDESEGL